MIASEDWKPAPGYEGRYEVSNHGHVRSLRVKYTRLRGAILRPCRAGGPAGVYRAVRLVAAGGKVGRHVYIHRLVAAAFLGTCPERMVVNHRDGDTANNALANLEYVTRAENLRHAGVVLGRRQGSAKLNEGDVRKLRAMAATSTLSEIGKRFAITSDHAREIIAGRVWASA